MSHASRGGTAAVSNRGGGTMRTVPLLQALAASPAGLSTSDLARRCAGDVQPRTAALTRCGNLLRKQEEYGRVRTAGTVPGSYHNVPALLWQITADGREYLNGGDGLPAGLVGLCILVLGMEGYPMTAHQVRDWLANDGDRYTRRRVYEALRYAASLGLAGRACAAGTWQLTEHAHAVMQREL